MITKYLAIALAVVVLAFGGFAVVQHYRITGLETKLEQSQKDLAAAVKTNKDNQIKFDAALATQKKLSDIAQTEAKAAKARADKYRSIADAIHDTPDDGTGVAPVILSTVDRLWHD